MKKPILAAWVLIAALGTVDCQAQGFLKKLKEKANQAIEKSVLGTDANQPAATSTTETATTTETSRSGRNVNKGGGGLTPSTAPDVTQQITDAEQAYNEKNFSDARFAVQQALQGVELQLGKQILKSLPLSVNDLPTDTTQDKVMSSSWGWSNLAIERRYSKGDKDFNISIGNNPLYSGLASAYFSGMYGQQISEKENVKQIKVKGNKAIVKYDDSDGYTLIIPLGQSSIMAFQAINFASEQELLKAANVIDIDGIKKMLGEQ